MSENNHSGDSSPCQESLGDNDIGKLSKYPPAPAKTSKKKIKHFKQTVFYDWCKACGICIAFCPKKVFGRDEEGKPVVEQPDKCNGCLFCELHCPDFAISIGDRDEERKRNGNGSGV